MMYGTAIVNTNLFHMMNRLFSDIKRSGKVNNEEAMQLGAIIGNEPFDVLLAEDDDDDYELFAEALSFTAPTVTVTRVTDGEELVQILEQHNDRSPDLIFLDLNMPKKNGFECLDAIKKSPKWKYIPVIIYSTSAYDDQVNTTYNNGANLYIQKPHSFIEIKRMFKKLLSINLNNLIRQPQKENFLLK